MQKTHTENDNRSPIINCRITLAPHQNPIHLKHQDFSGLRDWNQIFE